MPEDEAELLSDIRSSMSVEIKARRKADEPGDLVCARQNNFNGAGINANWRRS